MGWFADVEPGGRPYFRRALKNPRSMSALSCASTPPSTTGFQWQVGWSNTLAPCTTAPPLGSSAP